MGRQVQHFPGEEILQQKGTKDTVCVSIILPLHSPFSQRKEDRLILQKANSKVKEYLAQKNDGLTTELLIQSVDDLLSSVDINIHAAGIGFFVSKNVKEIIPFFLPVEEKVIVSNSFEIRDLIYQENYSFPYMVLHLTHKEARLFEGKQNTITEVTDSNFPRKYEDDYEYSRPSRGSSYVGDAFLKDFEQDKSRLEKLRYEQFTRDIDKLLVKYLNSGKKLLLAGVKNDLITFQRESKHTSNIIGQLDGNYTYTPQHEFATFVWKKIGAYTDKQKAELLSEFEEQVGNKNVVIGLPEIWKAASEGRAYRLLVEKDYIHPAFLVADDNIHLHLKPPMQPHLILADAINELIELVLSKDGEVTIFENGALENWQRIALVTRY